MWPRTPGARESDVSRIRLIVSVLSVLAGLAVSRSMAQEHQHGTGEKLGAVHFATSCNRRRAEGINRAVALLHSFQFSRAIEGFNAVLGEDATCAIAYWGIALSDWSNPFAPGMKDKGQLQPGRESVIAARAWAQRRSANGRISRPSASCTATSKTCRSKRACSPIATPWGTSRRNIRKTTRRRSSTHWRSQSRKIPRTRPMPAGSRRERFSRNCLQEEPTHPGLAHYIIHAYDVPALAGRALVAARRYAEIAPDAPHALHMPSHTFTRTGYWQESIDSNVAAAAAARREGQTAEELHASDYETYAYLQTGQDEAARRIVDSLPEIASRFDPKAVLSGAGPLGWIFCAGGDPGTVRAGTPGLAAGGAACAAGDSVSLHGCNDVVRPRVGRGATGTRRRRQTSRRQRCSRFRSAS